MTIPKDFLDEIATVLQREKEFDAITDIGVGPDGYMYIVTHDKSKGAIYRDIHSDND